MKRYVPALAGILVAGAVALLGGALAARPGTAEAGLTPEQISLLSGFASFEFLHMPESEDLGANQQPSNYFASSNDGCNAGVSGNVKVNTNCLNLSDGDLQGRGQAQNETAIAQDPLQTSHIVAGYNDYRRGDATCGASYSLDGGKTWADSTTPNGFTRGASFGGVQREYWQGSGDTAVAWDTKHNAYLLCQTFMRGEGASTSPVTNNPDGSSAFYVFRSTRNFGASYNFTGRPVVERFNDPQNPLVLLDKPYLAVDNHVGSPNQDRIYVTWTDFNQDSTAKIYEAWSNDYGEHFSSPVLVSGDTGSNPTLCPNSDLVNGTCDTNQDSVPFTGPDGALYVVFNNYNGADNGTHPQILLAKSTDGGRSFGPLVKVADFYELPDCATYQGGQDSGRACVPEKGASMNSVFRANNYPVGAVNPQNLQQVVVTFGSYINQHSKEPKCVATGNGTYTGVKTAGACNNDILLSVSNDGGATFTGTTADVRALPSVNQAAAQATTDQFWQWAAFTTTGKLAVSYYDRQYGNDETNGSSDISLSGSSDLVKFNTTRVTGSSMPAPTEFPDAQGNSLFYGDYAGLTAVSTALPLWSDTRNPDLFLCPHTGAPGSPPNFCGASESNGRTANDEDSFTSSLAVP